MASDTTTTELKDHEIRKLAAIGAMYTTNGLVERRPIEYRRELEAQFVRGFRAALTTAAPAAQEAEPVAPVAADHATRVLAAALIRLDEAYRHDADEIADRPQWMEDALEIARSATSRPQADAGAVPAAPTAAAAEQVSADEEAVLDKMVAKAWDRFEAEMERLQAPAAGAAPTPTDAEIDALLDSQATMDWHLADDTRSRMRLWTRIVLARWGAAAPAQEADAALLDFIGKNYLDLRCFDMPTGQGDAETGWRIVQHHMGTPHGRVVSEVYADDPRQAVREAMARLARDPYCQGELHPDDAARARQEGGAA